MIGAIVSAVAGLAGNIIGAVEGGANRRHERDMARYEATKYKTYLKAERTNTELVVLGIMGLLLVLLVWGITRKKQASK